MNRLLALLHLSRTSNRLIQSVLLTFVLSLGVAIAAPAMQAANLSPETQIICLGNGGMKTVTFAADGTATEVQTAHGQQCLQCVALQALLVQNHTELDLSNSPDSPVRVYQREHRTRFVYLLPPVRAGPFSFQN